MCTEDEGVDDVFSVSFPILMLADYQAEVEGWNISFVKKIVALVMVTLFLFLFFTIGGIFILL